MSAHRSVLCWLLATSCSLVSLLLVLQPPSTPQEAKLHPRMRARCAQEGDSRNWARVSAGAGMRDTGPPCGRVQGRAGPEGWLAGEGECQAGPVATQEALQVDPRGRELRAGGRG